MDELAAEYARLFATAAPGAPVIADVGSRLVALCNLAKQDHPDLAIDERELVVAIAAGCREDDATRHLEHCHAGALALALAAGRGDQAAIALLERTHRGAIDAACWRFVGPQHALEDLRQILREKLFVAAPGERPKITEYGGEGSLDNWLRVTAIRLFISLGRRKDRAREHPVSSSGTNALVDPTNLELAAIRSELRGALASAINAAARELSAPDRNILRLHLGDGLSIDELGTSLGIHRATAARRVIRAREQLAAATRTLAAQRFALPADQLDEIVELVIASKFDVSIGQLLASRSD